jgi:hypothetical protein
MRNLAPHGISEDVLHSLWMKGMPICVGCILSTNDRVELSKLVEIVDWNLEHSMQSLVMAMNNPCSKPPNPSQQLAVDFS